VSISLANFFELTSHGFTTRTLRLLWVIETWVVGNNSRQTLHPSIPPAFGIPEFLPFSPSSAEVEYE